MDTDQLETTPHMEESLTCPEANCMGSEEASSSISFLHPSIFTNVLMLNVEFQPMTRLYIPIVIETAQGYSTELIALVDTGCETNLIKPGLVPDCCFQPASRPRRFRAANQTILSGGQRELSCTIHMTGTDVDSGLSEIIVLPFTAHDADIGGGDVIFSYTWLAEQKIDIVTSRHGLQLQRSSGPVWIPGSKTNSCNAINTTAVSTIMS